jgi:predicted protein tyrosine phosphatase
VKDPYLMNRLGNSKNSFQGGYKRVLCVCSAGLLRSPTAAVVLSQAPFNYNTRAAGLEKTYALINVDEVLLHWADEIVCMTDEQKEVLETRTDKPVICLGIRDSYAYRDPELIDLIRSRYEENSVPGGRDDEPKSGAI